MHGTNLNSKILSIKINAILLKYRKEYLSIYLAIISKTMFLKYDNKNKIARNPYKGRKWSTYGDIVFRSDYCDRFYTYVKNIIVVNFLMII